MKTPNDLSESFEEYLTRANVKNKLKQALVKNKTHSLDTLKRESTMSQEIKQNTEIMNNDLSLFSPRTQTLLKHFSGIEQRRILKFWHDMITCFGQGKIRQEFGDEPNRQLMIFGASLDGHSHQRLINNLEERLRKGQEWPPSIAVFETLTRTPTDKEILEARTNILTLKRPISRVEQYIGKRKSAKLRTLSEKYIEKDFKTLYLEAFEEVILCDRDTFLDKQEAEIVHATKNIEKTKLDIQIDEMIESGYKPIGQLGKRLDKLNKLRKEGMRNIVETDKTYTQDT